MFGRKSREIALDSPQVTAMMSRAMGGEYGAVRELFAHCEEAIGTQTPWDWWLDRAAEATDHTRLAALDFMLQANVPPWGDLTSAHYQRRQELLQKK